MILYQCKKQIGAESCDPSAPQIGPRGDLRGLVLPWFHLRLFSSIPPLRIYNLNLLGVVLGLCDKGGEFSHLTSQVWPYSHVIWSLLGFSSRSSISKILICPWCRFGLCIVCRTIPVVPRLAFSGATMTGSLKMSISYGSNRTFQSWV